MGVYLLKEVAEKLRSLRESVKLSQVKMAEIVGVKQSSLNRYELNQASPTFETLTRYADYFDVSMDYIFGRTDNPQGKLYEYKPKIQQNDPQMQKFVEMCFDPKSPYYRKVDAVPFQAQYLAAAQAVQRGDIDDRVEALVFDGGQQIAHLCFRVERTGKLCCVGHDDQIGRVCLNQTVPLRQFERLIEHVLVLTQANRG